MKRKLSAASITSTTLVGTAAAHEVNNTAHHMMDTSMWGWHWTGTLFMLALWTLVILTIIYLGQKILDNTRGGEE